MKMRTARALASRSHEKRRDWRGQAGPVLQTVLFPVRFIFLASVLTAPSARAQAPAQAKNMILLAHNNLGGHGDGGEGMAIQILNGRRILYIAHEETKYCLSILDVTNPRDPELLSQLPSPNPGVTRCNSLGLSGNVLVVADQTNYPGQKPAGMWVLGVSNLARVRKAKRLEDLALSFFDTSGPHSRGVHWVWFVDGQFAHLSTGMPDFTPTNPNDDQFYVIVDLRDPRHPREVSRWWYPGTHVGDACLPGCLPPRRKIDVGYRPHNIEVYPSHPNEAFLGYIEGGAFILNIAGLQKVKDGEVNHFTPSVISHIQFDPPYPGFTHTFQPIFSRGLAVISDESIRNNCQDDPKLDWLLDIRAETNPVIIDTAPIPTENGNLCARGARFGSHNIAPYLASSTSANLQNSIVASWFDGGVRIFHITHGPRWFPNAPAHFEEIGYYIPASLSGNPGGVPQINHAIVDERGLIYAIDRFTGGLYILKYTGKVPLN